MMPPQGSGYNSQGYAFAPQAAPISEALNFPQTAPYGSTPSDSTPTWGYPQGPPMDRNSNFPPPVLPSIHSFGRTSTPATNVGITTTTTGEPWHSEGDSDILPYRAWNSDPTYPTMDNTSQNVFGNTAVDPSVRGSTNSDVHQNNAWPQQDVSQQTRYPQDAFPPAAPSSQFDHSMYASASYSQNPPPPQASYYSSTYSQTVQDTPPPPAASTIPPLPRHTYTRTLVGPLSSNACRLLDEHRKPGIFFLFQDLSVRTEGA